MPPPEYTAEALKGIQASTLAIVDQRRELNEAFESLRKAALALGYELKDDGSVRGQLTGKEIAKPVAPPVVEAPPPLPPTPPEPPASGSQPVEAPSPTGDGTTLKQRIEGVLQDGRKTTQAVARALGEDPERVANNMRAMRTKGQLIRDEQLQYFLPAPTTTRKLPDAERPPTKPVSEPKVEASETADQTVPSVGTQGQSLRPAPADPSKPARDEDEKHVYTWNVQRQRWSATLKGPYKQQVKEREEDLLKLFDHLLAHPEQDWTAGEAADAIGIGKGKVNKLFTEGCERGFFYLADRRRSSTSPPGTRYSDAFKVVAGAKFTTVSKLPPMDRFAFYDGTPQQAPKVELPRDTSSTRARYGIEKNDVRDAVIKLGKFTMPQLIKELVPGLSSYDNGEMKKYSQLLEPLLAEFATKGMLVCHLHPGVGKEWTYKKPAEPGKAAEHDAKRGKGLASHEARAPIAGTGGNTPYQKALKRASKEVKGMLEQVAGKVGQDKIGVTQEGHFAIKKPGGGQVIIAPNSNSSGYVKDRARLRREGLITA